MDPDKLHPTLREMIEPDTVAKGLREGTPVPTELPVIVRYRAATPRSARAQAAPAGWSFELTNSTAMTVNLQELGQLTEDPNVALVWPDLPVYALLNDSVPVIRAPEVWSLGYAGRGVTIAIIDTGIDGEHPDLVGRVIDQKDFTGEGPGDGNGHGTHVASIAAGSGAASQGRYRGVAPEASLLAVRVLGRNGSGRQSNVMAGIEWAIERGAKIINLSLGGPPEPGDGTDALSAQVDAAVRAGVVCVVAAGNSGPSARTVGSPGSAREPITVGASVSDRSLPSDSVADFSSRGPTADGRVKPDVVFPGSGIVAARAGGTSLGRPVNDHYTTGSGTSMATPHAAGVAALLLQAEPTLTPAQIKERMIRAARSMGLDANIQGAGRVDALAAARGQAGEPLPAPTQPPTPPLPGPPTQPPSGCLPVFIAALFNR